MTPITGKSYVSLQQAVCPVCGKTHDVGVLLDKRLRNSLDRTTVTHYEMCPEHKELWQKGFVALVEADPEKSGITGEGRNQTLTMENAYRTGRLAHLRMSAFKQMFNVDPPKGGMLFIDPEVMDLLEKMESESHE
jgi:hypothetical protein